MRQDDQFQTSFCFFKKALYEVKASGVWFNFNKTYNLAYNKNKLYKTLNC